MKTINYGALVILAIAIFAFAFATAQETVIAVNSGTAIQASANNKEIASIDEEFNGEVSSFDITMERVKNWFTFSQDKKTAREFKIAKMLLIKAKIEAKNNDSEAMDGALEAHNEILERIEIRIKERPSEDDSTEEADKLVGLDRAIQVHQLRIERLNFLLENENLTAEQRVKIEARISKAEDVTGRLEEVKSDKVDKLKIRLMAKANLTEGQADAVIAELKDFNEIRGLKEAIKESREQTREERKQRTEDKDDDKDDRKGKDDDDNDDDDDDEDLEVEVKSETDIKLGV